MPVERISVVGIGKLGLCLATCLAYKGYRVIGVDTNPEVLKTVNQGKPHFYEPKLAELMSKAEGHLSATDDYHYAISNSEVTFIVVPTSSTEEGGFSNHYVEAAARSIAQELKSKNNFHSVIIVSTVMPGTTEGVIKPLIEATSSKKCGEDFGLCYNPEFIALGNIIRGMLSPDFIIIGESDTRSGNTLDEVYQRACDNNPLVIRMTPVNAELAKIALNVYITMKISFANMMAELCEHIPGGDADAVSKALGADSRIGSKYLAGGLSYGGPCFPRDTKSLSFFAETVGCQAKLSQITEEVNKDQTNRIIRLIEQKLGGVKDKNIAILGLTYKPNTDVVEESASVKIAFSLKQKGARISVYDPAGMGNARKILEESVKYAQSVEECLTDADFCILATPWDEFKSLKAEDFTNTMKKPVLLDCWRVYDRSEFSKKLDYMAIGLGPGC